MLFCSGLYILIVFSGFSSLHCTLVQGSASILVLYMKSITGENGKNEWVKLYTRILESHDSEDGIMQCQRI